MGVGCLWRGLFRILVQKKKKKKDKISWLHVTSHINLHTTSMLLAEAKGALTPIEKQKRKPSVLSVEMSGMLKSAAELSAGKSASTSF